MPKPCVAAATGDKEPDFEGGAPGNWTSERLCRCACTPTGDDEYKSEKYSLSVGEDEYCDMPLPGKALETSFRSSGAGVW